MSMCKFSQTNICFVPSLPNADEKMQTCSYHLEYFNDFTKQKGKSREGGAVVAEEKENNKLNNRHNKQQIVCADINIIFTLTIGIFVKDEITLAI